MSSATASLFAGVFIAIAGASFFAFALTHPGAVTSFVTNVKPAASVDTLAEGDGDTNFSMRRAGENMAPGTVELRAGDYGHFMTEAEINGRSIGVMVDTGASMVALSYEDAERAGIYVKPSDFTAAARTANGIARVAPVTISRVTIGEISVRGVSGVVSERGASERSLLGMSFLGRLSRVEMRDGTLILHE